MTFMKMLVVGGLLSVSVAHQVMAEIKKCKGSDGKVYYTDKLCPGETKLEESIAVKSRPASASATAAQSLESREIVKFEGGAYAQFSKAQGIVKVTAIEGRNCEWSITVEKKAYECEKFLRMLVEGSAYNQAVAKITSLPQEDKNNDISAADYQEVLTDVKKVVRYKNLLMATLGQLQ